MVDSDNAKSPGEDAVLWKQNVYDGDYKKEGEKQEEFVLWFADCLRTKIKKWTEKDDDRYRENDIDGDKITVGDHENPGDVKHPDGKHKTSAKGIGKGHLSVGVGFVIVVLL